MEILCLETGDFGVNTYLVSGDGQRAFVVDPGGSADKILYAAAAHGWRIDTVLLTHGHFDHIGAVKELREQGARVLISAQDKPMLSDPVLCAASFFGLTVALSEADGTVADGDGLSLAGTEVLVIATPGHTPGGVCYYLKSEKVLFSGDTLFAGSVGRTDLPGGDMNVLLASIRQKLFLLPDDTRVLPGHGEETSMMSEKYYNPFM